MMVEWSSNILSLIGNNGALKHFNAFKYDHMKKTATATTTTKKDKK